MSMHIYTETPTEPSCSHPSGGVLPNAALIDLQKQFYIVMDNIHMLWGRPMRYRRKLKGLSWPRV